MEMEKEPQPDAQMKDVTKPRSSMKFDGLVIVLVVLVIVLVVSNFICAFAFMADDEDDDDDDDNGNGGHPSPDQIIENLTVNQSHSLIQNNTDNDNFVILDVRTPGEYADGYIAEAINIDFFNDSFEAIISILDKDLSYLVYCGVGGRSSMAVEVMENEDFMEVYNMLGGFNEWVEMGYEVEGGGE